MRVIFAKEMKKPGEVVFGIIRKSGAFVLAGLAPLKPEAGDEIVYSRAID